MKKLTVLFTICMFVFLFSGCGGPEPVNTEDGGAVTTDGGVNDGGPATVDGGVDGGIDGGDIDAGCCHPDGGQGTDGGPAYDGGTDGGDPLAEYMWIQGNWRLTLHCTTVLNDGGISNCENNSVQTVDVTVESWDDVNGATVRGFDPMGTIFIKKNTETIKFEINIVYPVEFGGGSCEGTAERENLKIKMIFKATNTAEEEYYEWEKQ